MKELDCSPFRIQRSPFGIRCSLGGMPASRVDNDEVPNEVRRSMVENAERLPTLEQVHQYVAHTLSRLETLDPDRFPLTHQILNRSGKPCGIYYCLQGPRAVRLTAIWETEQNTILFYGSCGRRMQRTRLLEAPFIEA